MVTLDWSRGQLYNCWIYSATWRSTIGLIDEEQFVSYNTALSDGICRSCYDVLSFFCCVEDKRCILPCCACDSVANACEFFTCRPDSEPAHRALVTIGFLGLAPNCSALNPADVTIFEKNATVDLCRMYKFLITSTKWSSISDRCLAWLWTNGHR